MQTTINQINPVEYEFVIDAEAGDLAEAFEKALRAQRARTDMKGFRPGRVPTALVKKMYGRALAYGVAEQKVQETYEQTIVEGGEYQILGSPQITQLDYEMDGDLHAVIRFGVRPEVEIADLSGERIPKLAQEIGEEEVDKAVERLRRQEADLAPVEDEGAGEEDQVTVDMQQVDEESGTPIVGEREEDVTFFVDDERLHDALRDGLLGKKPGDAFQVDLPHGEGEHAHTHRYEVTIKEVKRRELPELTDEFVQEATDGRLESVEALRAQIREQLEGEWKRQSNEMFEGMVIERLLELHPVPVPNSAIEMFLDYFIEDVKKNNEDKLPEDFDEQAFRNANRGEAENQARWMLIRDALVEQEKLEVTEEDLDAYFEEASAGNEQVTPQLMRQYYQSMGMLDRVKHMKLSERVMETLAQKFDVVELDSDAFEEEMKARQAERAKQAPVADQAAEGLAEAAVDVTEQAAEADAEASAVEAVTGDDAEDAPEKA